MGVLDGKVVLVTGGGNGIGRECALIAAREGAKVVVNDLGGGLAQRRRRRLGRPGRDGGPGNPRRRRRGGVSNSDSVTSTRRSRAWSSRPWTVFGGLHAVINPAGILRDGMFHKMADADWDAVIDVHLRGSYNVCRATIELFRDQQDGAYVLFTSTSGLIGNIGQTNYGAAKLGIAGPVADHRHGGRVQERPLQHHRAGRLDPDDASRCRSRTRPAASASDGRERHARRPAGQAGRGPGLGSRRPAKAGDLSVCGQIFGA
jgi:hypothetical protein